MKKIELFIIPYAKENEVKTRLVVDGNQIDSKDNRLTNLVVYQPMRKWLNPYKKKLFVWDGLLPEVIEEFNDRSIRFVFHGCKADYIFFNKNILAQQMKLNRNGGAVDAAFELVDQWDPAQTVKELVEILDDLRVEADNWGEDGIIREIDDLKSDVQGCKIRLRSEFLSSPAEFQGLLRKHHIGIENEARLTVIPIDQSAAASGVRDTVSALLEEADADGKYIVVNTSAPGKNELFDALISLDSGRDTSIRYIENDGEDYITEIGKVCCLSMLPEAIRKAIEIVLMFPDHDTNSYLIDISDRIEDLFHIKL